jgi:hypothetical protein
LHCPRLVQCKQWICTLKLPVHCVHQTIHNSHLSCCLQRRFGQGPGAPTASSKSAAATPVLAVYSAEGEPLW